MNEGWANCSTLFWIDTHELPLGSIPPVAPALAISSAGFAPNAAEDKTTRKAMRIKILTVRNVCPRWRFEGRPIRIMFDVFIFAAGIFLVSRKLAPIFRQRTAVRSMLLRDSQSRQAKLSYLRGWRRLTPVRHQSHIPSRQGCGKGIGLPSLYSQGFSRRLRTGHVGINPGDNGVLACR